MTHDILERLRERDPAGELDGTPPAELLARLMAEPRDDLTPPTRPPLARRPLVRVAVAGVATAALLAGVSAGINGDASPDLAARAYAQTDAGADILHVVLRGRTDLVPHDSSIKRSQLPDEEAESVETWLYGREAHTVIEVGDAGGTKTFSSDQLLGGDGVLRNRLSDSGETQTLSPSDGAEAREIIARSRRGFVAEFRARYERGVLDESGPTTFMGRSARRYVVEGSASRLGGREQYFLDAATGAPLGMMTEMTVLKPEPIVDGKPVKPGERFPASALTTGEPLGTMRHTTIVERIEHLPATDANLAKVRER